MLLVGLACYGSGRPAGAATSYTAGRTTTAGSVMYDGQQNVLSATQVTTGSAAGILTRISVYVGGVQAAPLDHMQVGLYRNTSTNLPGAKVTRSATVLLRANSWNALPMPTAKLAADTSYWLVLNVDGRATQVPVTDVTGGHSTWMYPATFGTWPTTYGTPSRPVVAKEYSIYLTYTSTDTPQPSPGSTSGCGLPTTPGAVTKAITVNGVQRTYLLVVPAGLNPNTPTPVIMGFHGGSGTSAEARQTYGLEAGSEPVIYVYPQAPYWPQAGGVAWNVDPNGVDFPYFDSVLTHLKSEHCVDSRRVFAAGKSNGGFFVNSLACNRPNDIRALASVAGGGPQNACSQAKAAMIIHGAADTTVSISAGRYSRDYWLTINQYPNSTPVPVSPAPCVSYPGTLNPVIWCQHGGAHVWPSWAGPGILSFFLSLS
jgi:polyhydroxybutyrate depolymerase